MELSEELKRELKFLECALHNGVFSTGDMEGHMGSIMQDRLTVDHDGNQAIEYGSNTRHNKDGTYPSVPSVYSTNDNYRDNYSHDDTDDDFFLISLFSNVGSLYDENVRLRADMDKLISKMDKLEIQSNQLATAHNDRVDYIQSSQQRIYL